jgi:HSP20 family protein
MFVLPVSRVAARAYRQPAYNGHTLEASRALDRLFNDTFERVLNAPASGPATRLPALDLQEVDAAYTAQVDLPGFSREDVKVSIDGKRVSIEAVTQRAANSESPADSTPQATSAGRVIVRERSGAAFSRSFTLPVEIDEAASQAKLENGVLTLTLAKKLKPASQLTIG